MFKKSLMFSPNFQIPDAKKSPNPNMKREIQRERKGFGVHLLSVETASDPHGHRRLSGQRTERNKPAATHLWTRTLSGLHAAHVIVNP